RGPFLDTGAGGMPQQRAALCEFLLPYAVGQEAEVPQPVEAMWRDVEHQPPQEFDGVQGQRAQAMAALVILVAEGHLAVRQGHEVQPPEPPREDPDGQEEVGATRHPPRAISSDPPGRQDTMEMGVMVELLAPGVQHGETADLRPEMLRVPGDVLEGLGNRA